MNKKIFTKLETCFNDYDDIDGLINLIQNKLKKFKISRKKRFFIRYKYPHRRSESHYKSYVTLKRYLTKQKKWYTAKKGCLRFNNFEKLYEINVFGEYFQLNCKYDEY